jgi:hypothetical protein
MARYKHIVFLIILLLAWPMEICLGEGGREAGPEAQEIDPGQFGAKGDGITDDTAALQKALTLCSTRGWRCKIPGGKEFLVKAPLFMWGNASLEGQGETSSIAFDAPGAPYLFNIGISGRNRVERTFNGRITGVKFKINGGQGGRIIYFWRTNGAEIADNVFDVDRYIYSATSSGNDQRWLGSVSDYVRKNVVIRGNIIKAKVTNEGSEGIGLGHFDGALIEGNKVIGVGDDPIGIHFSRNIRILNNDVKSVDGRIYVSNSKNVVIAHNRAERMASGLDGRFYQGIALIYIGFETFEANGFAAPTNISIHHNTLVFPEGSIDGGGVIYLYGLRNVSIEHNRVINDSSGVKAAGLRLLPAIFSGPWRDPDRIDPPRVARVWGVTITGNTLDGKHPLPMLMTGKCADFMGPVVITGNVASDFNFYCQSVRLTGNTRIK